MKCPNDQTEMKEGSLVGEGGWWRGKGISTQIKTIFGDKRFGAVAVKAYRCPKCGKVELIS